MAKRDEEIYEERRRQIIRGALAVFSEVGYEKATNREIARAAGIGSPGLIYHYFKDKADLFGQVIEEVSPGLHLIAVGDPLLDRPPHEMMPRLAAVFLSAMSSGEGRAFFRMVMGEALRRPEMAGLLNHLALSRVFTFLAHYLEAQMAAGVMRRADPTAAALDFMGPMLTYVLAREVFALPGPAHLSPDEMIATTVETFLRGMEYRAGDGDASAQDDGPEHGGREEPTPCP